MTPAPPPGIGDGARLRIALALSLLVHGLLVLGIGFSTEDAAPVVPTLDVILTETTSPLTQAQADFLAQASHQGGGQHARSLRPRGRSGARRRGSVGRRHARTAGCAVARVEASMKRFCAAPATHRQPSSGSRSTSARTTVNAYLHRAEHIIPQGPLAM